MEAPLPSSAAVSENYLSGNPFSILIVLYISPQAGHFQSQLLFFAFL
jgi:hypothetical protein